jgi:hypothetical protein
MKKKNFSGSLFLEYAVPSLLLTFLCLGTLVLFFLVLSVESRLLRQTGGRVPTAQIYTEPSVIYESEWREWSRDSWGDYGG